MYKKIGFLGLGLIGGSIAKTIKEKYKDTEIIALTSSEKTISNAYTDGIISNNAIIDLKDFSDCNLIFLCSPVEVNITYLKELKNIISKECIITDVGSVKGEINNVSKEIGLDGQFIGGHPMCGSEKFGYTHSTPTLLENAYYIITPNDSIKSTKVKYFENFIKSLGAITFVMTSEKHDFITAAVSHLPHVISASLVNTVKNNDTDDQMMKEIASGGFRDITRITSSSPVMWENICQSNKDEILHLFNLFEVEINTFKKAIQESSNEELLDLFSNAKEYRDSLAVKKTGLLPNVYEFYCDLNDEAGAIAFVSTLLAIKGISIKNIGIINNREFEDGVMRIEVYDEESMNNAIEILRNNNYTIYER